MVYKIDLISTTFCASYANYLENAKSSINHELPKVLFAFYLFLAL